MKLYDPDCYQLAEHFLAEDVRPHQEERLDSLAAAIQKAVEDWLVEDRLPSTAHFFPAGEGQ